MGRVTPRIACASTSGWSRRIKPAAMPAFTCGRASATACSSPLRITGAKRSSVRANSRRTKRCRFASSHRPRLRSRLRFDVPDRARRRSPDAERAEGLAARCQDLAEELFLGLEVPVEDALSHPEPVDDVRDRSGVVADRGEPPSGEVDQLLSAPLSACGQAACHVSTLQAPSPRSPRTSLSSQPSSRSSPARVTVVVMAYWVLKVLLSPIFFILWRVRTEGREHVPARGPVILASNHVTFLDSMFLPLVIRRRVTFVAKAEYFDSWKTAWFFRAVGQIPMRTRGRERLGAGTRRRSRRPRGWRRPRHIPRGHTLSGRAPATVATPGSLAPLDWQGAADPCGHVWDRRGAAPGFEPAQTVQARDREVRRADPPGAVRRGLRARSSGTSGPHRRAHVRDSPAVGSGVRRPLREEARRLWAARTSPRSTKRAPALLRARRRRCPIWCRASRRCHPAPLPDPPCERARG